MRKNYEIAKNKVYSDFYTGLSIAWFTGAVIAPFFSKSFDVTSLVTSISGVIETLIFYTLG